MRRMTSNRLLVGALALFGGYVLFALLPFWSGYVNAIISGMLLVVGLLVMTSWGRDAYHVVKSGIVEGPQLALVGVTIVAAGSVYSGAFGLLWALAGEPTGWLGTPFSAFGRYTMSVGFALQFLSPEAADDRIRAPRWWYLVGVMILVAIVAFALGTRWGDARTADAGHRVVQAQSLAASNCPVIGNDRSGVYHDVHSPDRARLRGAKPCFQSVNEARIAGYRPPR